jgi:hypothetical protein
LDRSLEPCVGHLRIRVWRSGIMFVNNLLQFLSFQVHGDPPSSKAVNSNKHPSLRPVARATGPLYAIYRLASGSRAPFAADRVRSIGVDQLHRTSLDLP